MAPFVRFLIHHKRRECAWFFGGDEHFRRDIPKGWEELVPREVFSNPEFDEWIQLDREDRVRRMCPSGYRSIGELK